MEPLKKYSPGYSYRQYLSFAIDVVLLIACFINAPLVLERARVPFSVGMDDRSILVTGISDSTASGSLRTGDRLMFWNKTEIGHSEKLEFLGDIDTIGTTVHLTARRDTVLFTADITLVPYYPSPRFLVISLCVGFITWLVAIFILFQRNNTAAADVLHWALTALGVSIMITWGHVDQRSLFSGISRTIFFICYTTAPALFVLFTTMYPHPTAGTFRSKMFIVLLITIPLITAQSYLLWQSIYYDHVAYFPSFQLSFSIFNGYLLFCFAVMVTNLFRSYSRAVRVSDKRRLEWIIWGFCASPVPFVLFIKLPQIVGFHAGLIDEEFTTFFFLLIPFSCAISLVQHNLLDIQLVISRSIIYTVLTMFASVIYLLTILMAATSVDTERQFGEYLIIGTVILMTGLILNPLRKKMQRTFDETLFPTRVSFRKTSAEIREALHRCLTADDVYRTLMVRVPDILSFESFAVYEYAGDVLVKKGSQNISGGDSLSISETELLQFKNSKAAAVPAALNFHSDEKISSDGLFLNRLHCTVCLPFITESGRVAGLCAGTPSAVAGQFTEEEIDLLITICAEAGEVLERLALQEAMIIQNEEKKRMEELSTMKSYFVSSVSHELRTPLTSIRMFAEMLRLQRSLSRKDRQEYLSIIEGESERLSRLVDTVLDFSAIERRTKEYRFAAIDLHEIVRRSANALRYQVLKHHARLTVSIAKNIPRLYADGDALEEVFINLLSNALKYSLRKPVVRLRVSVERRAVVINISDRGIGIPKDELDNIFNDFYRVSDPRLRQAGGTGLGLSLVKHIVEAHNGTITVQSIVGKGSTFTVRLPITERNHV